VVLLRKINFFWRGKKNFIFTVLFLAILTPISSFADKIKNSQSLVTDIYRELSIISELNLTESEQKEKLNFLFEKYVDVKIIARAVLGGAWRQASPSQKDKFISAFKEYASNKYGKQFSEFKGTKLKIQKSKDTGTKAGVLVSSYLTVPGRDSIKVIWQVSDGSGFVKLIDIKVEGISMLSTERQEIRSKLKKASGSINKLIIDMQREES
jgi:phospholipid transport system substrate-binding protein